MALSIDTYLKEKAYSYYISYSSTERKKIDTSVATVKRYLKNYFGSKILSIDPFGSYTRNTIIPRTYDDNSDVDIMIVFDHNKCGVLPETYRNWLSLFANLKYPRTSVTKDFPTIVVDMVHIKLDLIPTIIEKYWWENTNRIKIPDKNNNWQETDPNGFNKTLIKTNQNYNEIVKPIIRLLKSWNCRNGYPYSSYELEQIIANMNFSGDNYQKGFFYAIENLPSYNLTYLGKQKLKTLKTSKNWIIEYLERGDLTKAKQWLHKIIPY